MTTNTTTTTTAAALKARAADLDHTTPAGDVFSAGVAEGLCQAAELLEQELVTGSGVGGGADQDGAHFYGPRNQEAPDGPA